MTLMVTEQCQLKRCEETIEKGMATFVDVGRALAEIREKKLYRDTHKRFEDYCKERWGHDRRWASRMIKAADTSENVAHGRQKITSERQARALSRVPEEHREEVLERASQNGKVTAATIEEAADEVDDGLPVELAGNEEEAEDDAWDFEGMAVPYKRAVNDLDRIKRDLKSLNKDPLQRIHVHSFVARVTASIASIRAAISMATPIKVCPRCEGEGCNTCQQSGYWTRSIDKSRREG